MLNLVEHPGKSVLCIGRIPQDRYENMALTESYRVRLRAIYRELSSESFNTYIHLNWDFFDIVSAGLLQTIRTELIAGYCLPYVYQMGVFGNMGAFYETPPYTRYLDDVLYPQNDDAHLTAGALLSDVLANVSLVLCDNPEGDPFVRRVISHAWRRNKRVLDIGSAK